MSFQNCKIVCREANPRDYHRQEAERGTPDFVMSSGSLREFARCQRRWKNGYESPESKAKRHGNLFDCLLLTPKQFDRRYVIRPATYETSGMECPQCHSVTDSQKCRNCGCARKPITVTKDWSAQSDTCQEWEAAQKKDGLEVVTREAVENAQAGIRRLLDDEILAGWHAACDTQVWVAGEWKDDKTGLIIPCRCLIDYAPRPDSEFLNCAGDLKTTRSGALRPFDRWAKQSGYHIQGAWDLDMLSAAEGHERSEWCLVLSENFHPWEPARRMIDPTLINDARLWYQHQMTRYAHALTTGKWLGYDDHARAVQGWSVIERDERLAMWEAGQAAEEAAYDAGEDQPAESEEPETDDVPTA